MIVGRGYGYGRTLGAAGYGYGEYAQAVAQLGIVTAQDFVQYLVALSTTAASILLMTRANATANEAVAVPHSAIVRDTAPFNLVLATRAATVALDDWKTT